LVHVKGLLIIPNITLCIQTDIMNYEISGQLKANKNRDSVITSDWFTCLKKLIVKKFREKEVIQTTTKMPSTMKVIIGKWNSAIMGQERGAMHRQIKTRKRTVKKSWKAKSRLDKKIMKKDNSRTNWNIRQKVDKNNNIVGETENCSCE
jgi:hypothetical protein